MRRILRCLLVSSILFAAIDAEFAAVENVDISKESNRYDDAKDLRDFKKVPDNGLLIIRLLPKSSLKGTVLEEEEEEQRNVNQGRTKLRKSNGGSRALDGVNGEEYGGDGGPGGGGGFGGGPGDVSGYIGGLSEVGWHGGGKNGGGGGAGGKSGAWSTSFSGAYGDGY